MEPKRYRISALIDIGRGYSEIICLISCSLGLVSKVQSLNDEHQWHEKKFGSGGHNRNMSWEFMKDIKAVIQNYIIFSTKSHPKNLSVDSKTIGTAIRGLRVFS
ncbi:unnamed protein product [Lepeophtheirus salmonis]|uniref:(salmon louse) hypothetical protein n=1 Tax=Lepeophtheirus salmonis TaxID=72036 RepID=A0A7R8CVL6_LEPSM|nr:unnamed protein product [Lepeophtheirus salmonis]CAF2913339.1 unnamed protein product [Lepeophtheirus salmonis]